MTLQLLAIADCSDSRKSHIAMMADGRRTVKRWGATAPFVQDNYQKIYPVPHRPIAIAHYDQNILDGRDVGYLLYNFYARQEDWKNLSGIFSELERYMQSFVDRQIAGDPSAGVGFLFVGFDRRNRLFAREIYWDPKNIKKPTKRPLAGGIATAGAAYIYAPKDVGSVYTQAEMLKCPTTTFSSDYLDAIYREADKVQMGKTPQLFGGLSQKLLLTPKGWKWISPISAESLLPGWA